MSYFNMKFQLGCVNRIPGKVYYLYKITIIEY